MSRMFRVGETLMARSDSGQTLVEYAIAVAAISILLIAGLLTMMTTFEAAIIAKALADFGALL